jgi:hypothetical protein
MTDDWAVDQIDRASLPEDIRGCCLALLSTWDLTHPEGTPERKSALALFSELAQRHPIVNDPAWVDGKPGRFVVRDRVRVRHDAYQGPAGAIHNGREGYIVGIRSGDILVTYDDSDNPAFNGVRHSPYKLEKRIR